MNFRNFRNPLVTVSALYPRLHHVAVVFRAHHHLREMPGFRGRVILSSPTARYTFRDTFNIRGLARYCLSLNLSRDRVSPNYPSYHPSLAAESAFNQAFVFTKQFVLCRPVYDSASRHFCRAQTISYTQRVFGRSWMDYSFVTIWPLNLPHPFYVCGLAADCLRHYAVRCPRQFTRFVIRSHLRKEPSRVELDRLSRDHRNRKSSCYRAALYPHFCKSSLQSRPYHHLIEMSRARGPNYCWDSSVWSLLLPQDLCPLRLGSELPSSLR